MNTIVQNKYSKILPKRRLCQIGTALALIVIPLLNMRDCTLLSGNLLSFNLAGLPLADPLAVLQAAIGSMEFTPAMLIGGGLPLLLAMVLGRVFCSWMCPYGLLSEWIYTLKRRRKRGPAEEAPYHKGAEASEKITHNIFQKTATMVGLRQNSPIEIKDNTAHLAEVSRLILTLGSLAALWLMMPIPLLNQLSMPGWYSRAWQYAAFYGEALWGAIFILSTLLLAEYVTEKRFWCRYICPQALLISLVAALPFGLKRRFKREKCTCAKNDRPCAAACSLELNTRSQGPLSRLECTNCGDCVDACQKRGKALSLSAR